MPRSELTTVLRRARELHDYVQALTDDERNYLLDLLVPEPDAAPVVKKRTRKKGGGSGASKSRRATGMAAALRGSLDRAREVATDDITGESEEPLHAQRCGTCGNPFGYQDHHHPSPNYHEFDVGKSPARSAEEEDVAVG